MKSKTRKAAGKASLHPLVGAVPVPHYLRKLGVVSGFVCGVKTRREAYRLARLAAKCIKEDDRSNAAGEPALPAGKDA
jgi:hypothetical protein